jgi:hypothetical protein
MFGDYEFQYGPNLRRFKSYPGRLDCLVTCISLIFKAYITPLKAAAKALESGVVGWESKARSR